MFKSFTKNYILNANFNNFIIKSFRFNSSQFENLPLFKSDLSLDQLYPKSQSISDKTLEV